MVENYPKEILVKEGVFDFIKATDEYGIELDEYLNGNFENMLVKDTYIKDVIEFRESHISNNWEKLRFLAHKFKSSFVLFGNNKINELCSQIQDKLDKKENIEELYPECTIRMLEFFEAIVEMCQKLNKPISPKTVEMFRAANQVCEGRENDKTKERLNLVRSGKPIDKISQNDMAAEQTSQNGITIEKTSQNVCCCSIY